ncbi:hypothetical protein K435DRAFT_779794 [Dendrothele bispora CBS 962.96]|uniref:Chitin deacetylase n=1 Tax=Dendrothele bispora (strain CBS 962.96) TaxID=1314807 RepID=A0A4S8LVF3_DENBC|nr:hypothetical protein K435DRAFT_779794 [Dendrothele bispora CBS 962.96]
MARRLSLPLLLWVSLVSLVCAQDGSISGPTTSSDAAGYSCDPSQCQLPNCNCASTSPPGGLDPKNTPQFIVFTADDAIQSYTLDSVNQFLAHRKNPNGCVPRMTYYTSISYTNYTLVTDFFVAGNEIADHTMTHVGSPPPSEINGNLIALNSLAGIPLSSIKGFRAPFLNYTADTLRHLYETGFMYDSSASASIPVTVADTDAYWPYTLDNGMANDCLMVEGTCKGQLKLPGFWEVPMYAFFDRRGVGGPHLMDPWLDNPNGGSSLNDSATLEYMKKTFTDHYNGNRQPIGLYTHPIHLSRTYPGVNVNITTINMINSFLDWAQSQENVWIVSTEQLLAWVRNPRSVDQMGDVEELGKGCSMPDIPADEPICNGIPQNEEGLLSHCSFAEFPFYTCYGCPVALPTPDNPNPSQQQGSGSGDVRFRLPSNCSTPFWDPIGGQCTCSSSDCAFQDQSRPIGPGGSDWVGGGTGGGFADDGDDGNGDDGSNFVPFSGAVGLGRDRLGGMMVGVAVGLVGMGLGEVW